MSHPHYKWSHIWVPPCKWPEQKNNGFRLGYKLQTPISGGFGFPILISVFFGFHFVEKHRRVFKGWLKLPGHWSNEENTWLFRVCRRLYFPGLV